MLRIFLLLFGAIVIAGGVQGYLKGSNASIIAGSILGALLIAAGLMLIPYPTPALIVGSLAAVAILGKFLPDFLKAADKGAALWPAGVLSVLAVVALVLIAMRFAGR